MRKILLGWLCLAPSLPLVAQDSLKTKKLKVSGYADVYYKYNFNDNATDNKTSFTGAQNAFALGMLSVKLQQAVGRVSFTGDLGLGQRAEEFSYHDRNTSAAIKQLFVSYSPWNAVTLTLGSFSTYIGYESVDADVNHNYSMSYLFSYGPFFHTGLKATARLGRHTLMAGVFNPADRKYGPWDGRKDYGAQWAYASGDDSFSSALNYLGGVDSGRIRHDQVDVVLTYRLNAVFSLAYDGSYCSFSGSQQGSWWGSAVYGTATWTKAWSVAIRAEYFQDRDDLTVFDPEKFPQGGSIWSVTLSGNYRIHELTLLPEIRFDRASVDLFTRKDDRVPDSPSFLLAAVYRF
jgi:hypothetical protein